MDNIEFGLCTGGDLKQSQVIQCLAVLISGFAMQHPIGTKQCLTVPRVNRKTSMLLDGKTYVVDVEGQPAEGVAHDHHDQHLDHLKSCQGRLKVVLSLTGFSSFLGFMSIKLCLMGVWVRAAWHRGSILASTQLPRSRNPEIFLFTAQLVDRIEIEPIWCQAMDFTNAVSSDIQS